MIHVNNLSLSFGPQDIFREVNWHVGPTDRVGLIGNNGSGKTTLMRLIAGEIEPDEGMVSCAKHTSFAYLPQYGVVHGNRTLYEEASSVFTDVKALQEEETQILADLHTLDDQSAQYRDQAMRLGEIQDRIRFYDGYAMEEKVEKVLTGLGFNREQFTRHCDEYSGGWQMRVALAKVLLKQPNMLLLDEPTNYLDIEARVFLQEWLKNYPHAILLVSHDRFFLDQVITRITDVYNNKLTDYHCNYSDYLVQREERDRQLREKADQIEEERKRLQSWIDRFRYNAKKAPMVQSRVKQLEKLEKIEIPPVRRKIHFNFPQPERSGKVVLEAENLAAGYGDGPDIFSDINFQLVRGEKVALVGVNGAGKTTLIKVLAGLLENRRGAARLGHNVSFDYFAQDVHKQLDPTVTVYQTLERPCPFDLVPQLRKLLGAFLFSGEDIDKKVSVLSGGERNRLALARMLLVPSNLLLMDEPTNHLDLDAKEVLLTALKKFDGTVLFVSHDRYFLDHLTTKVYSLENGECNVFPGGYADFLYYRERHLSQNPVQPTEEELKEEAKQSARMDAKEERVRKWKEEKNRKREIERLTKQTAELEEEVFSLESKAETLVTEMADPKYSTNFAELDKLVVKKEKLDTKIEKVTRQWEESASRLEELQAEEE